MAEQTEDYFDVTGVGNVDGPVGMDLGMWLHFETEKGKLKLKLSHEDAVDLFQKIQKEPSISASPKVLVTNAANSLLQLAAILESRSSQQENTEIADTLKGHATNLQTAASQMSMDKAIPDSALFDPS